MFSSFKLKLELFPRHTLSKYEPVLYKPATVEAQCTSSDPVSPGQPKPMHRTTITIDYAEM